MSSWNSALLVSHMAGRLEWTQNIVLYLRIVSSQQKKQSRVALSSIISFFLHCFEKLKIKQYKWL